MSNIKNLAVTTVAVAPVPATSGTSLQVAAGKGSFLPAVPFYATTGPDDQLANNDQAEIVLVTAISTDTVTIVRAQKGTTAKAISAGWIIANGIYVEDVIGTDVTVTTAATTAAKVGTTAAGNYSPTYGDVINVNFTLGMNVSNPTLNIDSSGAVGIRIGNTSITTALIGTTSTMVLKLWYDGTYWQAPGSQKNDNTTYSEIPSAEITAGTASTARAITGRRSKEIQDGTKAIIVSATAPTDTNKIWLDTTADAASTLANADTVDGFHASSTATPNMLLPLNSNGQSGEWWEELGRASLSTSASSLSLNFTPKKYIQIKINGSANSTSGCFIRLNGDSGATQYSRRQFQMVAASQNLLTNDTAALTYINTGAAGQRFTIVLDGIGTGSTVKSFSVQTNSDYEIRGGSGTWKGTADVSSVSITIDTAVSSTTLAAGTEIVVLGHN